MQPRSALDMALGRFNDASSTLLGAPGMGSDLTDQAQKDFIERRKNIVALNGNPMLFGASSALFGGPNA